MELKKVKLKRWEKSLDNLVDNDDLSPFKDEIVRVWTMLHELIPNVPPPQLDSVLDNNDVKGFAFRWSTLALYSELDYYSSSRQEWFFLQRMTNRCGGGLVESGKFNSTWLSIMCNEFSNN